MRIENGIKNRKFSLLSNDEYTISGVVSRPAYVPASEPIKVIVAAYTPLLEENNIVLKSYLAEGSQACTEIIIPAGETSASYSLKVKNSEVIVGARCVTANPYIVLNEMYFHLVDGLTNNRYLADVIRAESTDINHIDIELLKAEKTISGTLTVKNLPKNSSRYFCISIELWDNQNYYSNWYYDYFKIPVNSDNTDFSINVPKYKKGRKCIIYDVELINYSYIYIPLSEPYKEELSGDLSNVELTVENPSKEFELTVTFNLPIAADNDYVVAEFNFYNNIENIYGIYYRTGKHSGEMIQFFEQRQKALKNKGFSFIKNVLVEIEGFEPSTP